MNHSKIIEEIIKLDFKKVMITNFEVKEEKLIFTVEWKNKGCSCPKCWIRTTKRQDLDIYKSKTPLKHLVLSDNRLISIITHKRYFRCKKCSSHFLEVFDFEAKNWLHTKTFESYVLSSWWYMSGCQIARNTKSSPYKIHKILSQIDPQGLNKRWLEIMERLDEIFLWLDEHSFRWKDMILIITELKQKEVLAILPGITKKILDWWLRSLPDRIKKKIKWFSTDMNKGYRNSVQKEIWVDCYTVDKYHLVQEVNKMMYDILNLNKWLIKMDFVHIDDLFKNWRIKKDLMRKTKKKLKKGNQKDFKKYKKKIDNIIKPEFIEKNRLYNSKWFKINFKEITLDYYINWPTYKTLFCMREKNMSWYQKLRLRQITRDFDYNNFLKEARVLKENFIDALDEKNIEDIDRIIKEALDSEHYRIQQFGRTLTNWYAWIANFCKYSTKEFIFTNAYTEGLNCQCKIAQKVSYGFRYKMNYFRKLTAKFTLWNSQKWK